MPRQAQTIPGRDDFARSTEPFTTPIEALISTIDHDAAAQPTAP